MEQPKAHSGQNGETVNGASGVVGEGSLKIIVVGAGIGGLTAAVALRQQGHEVIV